MLVLSLEESDQFIFQLGNSSNEVYKCIIQTLFIVIEFNLNVVYFVIKNIRNFFRNYLTSFYILFN